jgi:hypothetical protein
MQSNIRLALKLSVTPLILWGVFLLLHTTGKGPEVTELSKLQSPDGQSMARLVYTVYTGHLTGDPALHEVYVGGPNEAPGNQTRVFAAEGGDYKIEWSGPRELRVTFSSAARVEFQQSQARGVSLRYGVGGW